MADLWSVIGTVQPELWYRLLVRSVDVMGNGRHDDYVIALREVESIDFKTACRAELLYAALDKV